MKSSGVAMSGAAGMQIKDMVFLPDAQVLMNNMVKQTVCSVML